MASLTNNCTKYQQTRKRDLSSTTLKARMKKIYNIFAAGWFQPDVVVPGSPTLPVFFSPVWRLFDAHLSVLRGAALGEDQLQFWEFSSPSIHLDSATKISRSCLAGSFFLTSASPLSYYWSNQDISFYKMILYLCYRMSVLHSVFGYLWLFLCWKYETPITCS